MPAILKLPPLNPLKVFAVVARLGNLTSAAHELCVSQSAVSRQITTLEQYLGVPLFSRERIGVRLTETGRHYAEQIGPALATIATATEQLTRHNSDNRIYLRTYTTLTAHWLIPRLPTFKTQYPDIDIAIVNSTAPLNFGREQCDAAIILGNGNWPDGEATLLFEDVIDPVCAPTLLDTAGGGALAVLRSKPLLTAKYRKLDWPLWLAHAGMSEQFEHAEKMVFSSSILAWQAAIDGLGTAIGQPHMLTMELNSGRLVRPFGKPLHTGKGHYLVTPVLQRHSGKMAAFKAWLIDQPRTPT